MKIKRLLQLCSAAILSVSSLLLINIPAAFAAGPYTCTWQGGGGNNNFSTAGNWTGCNSAAPQAGDDDNLVFPVTAAYLSPANDISGATFSSITFSGTTASSGYDITGQAFTVHGNITDSSTVGVGSNVINVPAITISLNAGGIIGNSNQPLVIGDNLLPGSDTLTSSLSAPNAMDIENNVDVYSDITGSYILVLVGSVHFGADNSFSNVVGVSSSATLYSDSADAFENASLIKTSGSTGATVSGSGNLGADIDIESGNTISPGDPAPGCLSGTNLTVAGTYDAVIGGTTACTGYDQITASGTINVSGGTLDVSLANGFTPTAGQKFTIINNTGSSAVAGTFSGLAEGSTITVGGYTFTISYVGGSGQSVVLTATGSSSGSSAPKAPDTGLALVAAHPAESLALSVAATISILGIALRLKPTKR